MFVDWRNLPAMTDAVQMAGWVWRGVVVWDKGISRNQPGRFRNDCEFVVWCSNGDLPIDWKAAKGTKAMPGVYHVPIVVTSNEGPWRLLFLVTTPDDGQRVTGGRCSAVRSLNRYHLKPSNRKKEQAKGNEVTSFLYRLLKITPTHMKTGPREGIYARYRKNSGPRSNRRTLMKRRERDIESGLRRQVEKMGGKQRVFVRSGNE